MAIYPIINKETGEQKVIEMSVHDITQWYNDNPEWQRDWSQGTREWFPMFPSIFMYRPHT